MSRGRALGLLLVALGGVLLAAGVGVVVAAVGGSLLGVGAGGALLGAELVAAGLFLVPTGPSRPEPVPPERVDGFIP